MFYRLSIFNNINLYLTVLLALTAIIGDYVIQHTKLHLFQAIFDNTTHSLIGGISWLIVIINFKNRSHIQSLYEIGLCAGLASLIDIDHFISAKSFYLKDATNLARRPLLHCTTFPLIFCTIFLLFSYYYESCLLKRLALIVLTAFLSHHTRDATRRGYWLYPFGSTLPVPYIIYVVLTCLIPYVICWLQLIIKINSKHDYIEMVI